MPDAGSVGSGIHAVCCSISLLSLCVIVEKNKRGDGRHLGDVTKTINTILYHQWTSLELPPSKSVTKVSGLYMNQFTPQGVYGSILCRGEYNVNYQVKSIKISADLTQFVPKLCLLQPVYT